MTLARCKQQFAELLADPDNRVIALAGKWGTGKSHLWKEVQQDSGDEQIKGAVYTSLFGLSSIAELKLKIAQGVVPTLKEGGQRAESIKHAYAGVKSLLRSVHSAFTALDTLALIAAPLMIKGRFIVIDDVERKHEKLSIDEILGFIDDCVQNLGCRIVLVLNSDQLKDKTNWDQLREKVIDQELQLDTSPSEAFDVAARLTPTDFTEHIQVAVEACQISNIRIVRKIIRVVNRLLASRHPLPKEVIDRVVPSAALLSAIHYRGLEDGPDFEFVLNFQSLTVAMQALNAEERGEGGTLEAKSRERWQLLLDRLGIRGTDEFEALVADYLKSGLIEGAAVGRIIDRYLVERRHLAAGVRVADFFERCIWHPEISEAALLDELRGMLPDVDLLDMFTVTSLHDQAVRFAGGDGLARELVDGWLVAFRQHLATWNEQESDVDFEFYRRPVHPDIAAEVRAAQAQQQPVLTVLDVCRRVRTNNGWGKREESVMQSVTPADYEAAIDAATGADLKLLLLQSMAFLQNRSAYDSRFGGATQSFLEACQTIVQRTPSTRLCVLIRDLFRGAGKESELAAPVAVVAAGGTAAP